MAKTKKQNKQVQLSPTKYIQTKARALPIHECLINSDWKKSGLAQILVCRKHVSGNNTIGVFLVDTFCLGVKNAYYRFNANEEAYKQIKISFGELNPMVVPYDLVHNIIYGAIEYAQDLGVSPHPDFQLAKYLLEEDTDAIPLIEIEFGVKGKPLLVANSKNELNKYLPVLKSKVPDIEVHLHTDNWAELKGFLEDDDQVDNSEKTESLKHIYAKKGFMHRIWKMFRALIGRSEK